jgi:acid phosphatase (class A)
MKIFIGKIGLTTLTWLMLLPACIADEIIRFPEEDWDRSLVLLIKKGPTILNQTLQVHVAPPPQNTSAQTKYELETLRAYKLERTQATRRKIFDENKDEMISERFSDVIELSRVKTPMTIRLLHAVIADVGYFVLREKQRYQRPRPSQLTSDLELVIPNPPHASYPSGHAAQHYAVALVLGTIDPDKKDIYINKAFDVARRREVAGVHYPSDSIAGFILAEFLVNKLMGTQEIQQLFQLSLKEF